jgi:hypothetical protein
VGIFVWAGILVVSIAWALAPWPGKWLRRAVVFAHLAATAYLVAHLLSMRPPGQGGFPEPDYMNGVFFLGLFLGPGAFISAFRLCRDV